MTLKPAARPVILFISLTYALTWAWWIPNLLPHLKPGFFIDRAALGPLDVQIGMLAPLLVALALRLFLARDAAAGPRLRGSLALRQPWQAYALAYLLPTGLGLAAIAINHFSGLGRLDWGGAPLLAFFPRQLLITLLAALTALGEEYGWRGYLMPKLMPLGPARATLITGLVWGLWHLPLLVTGLTYPGVPAALAVPVFVISVTLLSALFTGFQVRAGNPPGGVPVIAALIHGAFNALSELNQPIHMPTGSPVFTSPFGLTTALVTGVFVAAVYLLARRRAARPALQTQS